MRAAASGALLAFACAGHTAAAQPACPPGQWPARVTLDYDVTASRGSVSVVGNGALRFERDGSAYRLVSEIEAVGLYRARQSSRGTIVANGLQPDEYVETRSGRAARFVRFDWTGKRVEFSAAPDSPAIARAGLQDRATLLLQLGWQRRARPDAALNEIPVAGARRVALFRFERGGYETLQLPAGAIDAVLLQRPADADHDRIEVWLAPARCGLPVRIRYTDRHGGTVEYRMRAVRLE